MVTTRQRVLAWAPAIAYMLLIWGVSSISHVRLNFERVPFQDKGVHFVEYGALAVLVARALSRSVPTRSLLWVSCFSFLCTTTWGLIDEIHQAFVPGRVADGVDLLADALGAVLGAAGYALARISKRVRAG